MIHYHMTGVYNCTDHTLSLMYIKKKRKDKKNTHQIKSEVQGNKPVPAQKKKTKHTSNK